MILDFSMCKFLIFSFLGLFSAVLGGVDQRVDVTTSRGPIFGYHVNYGSDKRELYYGEADIFLGIPYVTTPVGDLRFKKPVPLTTFASSPWNATYFRDICPQNTKGISMSEDCLYLNIYTPNAKSNYKYPVMVYIHGGSFNSGYAAQYGVQGGVRNFVSRGVVIVTIQYRLGLLGFFTTHTDDFPPNRGLLDQVEALKWVQQEIANFGGDPYRVTLFGNSAGASSIDAHTYSPLSQNLFQQAILQSGTVFLTLEGALGFSQNSVDAAKSLCNFTKDDWNTYNYAALTTCLQPMNYSTFIQFDANSMVRSALGWKMSQDDYFLPDVPRNLYTKRPNIPKIIGTVKDEWSLFDLLMIMVGIPLSMYNKQWLMTELTTYGSFLGNMTNTTAGIMENVYIPPGTTDDDNLAWLKGISDIFTPVIWTGHVGRDVRFDLFQNNANVYLYEFTWPTWVGVKYRPPGWNPVFHTSELPVEWMNPDTWATAIEKGLMKDTDIQMADAFGTFWTNFAKFGQPSLDGSWAPVSSMDQMAYWELGQNQGLRPNYRPADRMLWNEVLPVLLGTLPPQMPDYNNGTHVYSQLISNSMFHHLHK